MIKKMYQSNKNPHSWLISPMVCGFAELGYRLWGLLFGGLCPSPWGHQWAHGSLCEGAGPGVSALGSWRWRLCGPCHDGQTPGAGPFTPASPFTAGASLAAIHSSHPLRTGWAGILGNTRTRQSACPREPQAAHPSFSRSRPRAPPSQVPPGYPPHPDQLGLAHQKPCHERTLPHLFSQHALSVPSTHTGRCMPL